MKTRIFVGASAAYACIVDGARTLDVRLAAGHSAPDSLRATAADWRAEAARLIARAELAERAADQLKSEC